MRCFPHKSALAHCPPPPFVPFLFPFEEVFLGALNQSIALQPQMFDTLIFPTNETHPLHLQKCGSADILPPPA